MNNIMLYQAGNPYTNMIVDMEADVRQTLTIPWAEFPGAKRFISRGNDINADLVFELDRRFTQPYMAVPGADEIVRRVELMTGKKDAFALPDLPSYRHDKRIVTDDQFMDINENIDIRTDFDDADYDENSFEAPLGNLVPGGSRTMLMILGIIVACIAAVVIVNRLPEEE